MRLTATILCILTIILTSCQSEHDRQVKMMSNLMESTENYDVMPNDSDARAVLYYMERHGSPNELQQAWRMMAKMYQRHGALFGEDFAYQMAVECIDTTCMEYDTLAVAEILGEWSMNQYYCLDNTKAADLARKAKHLAKTIGDSAAYYKYMGQEAYVYIMSFQADYATPYSDNSFRQDILNARSASEHLWQLGRNDLAVEAFFPVMACYNRGTMSDSVKYWLDRYTRYTRKDILHAESLPAVEFFLQKGDYFKYEGNLDSARCYYQKLFEQSKNYVKGIACGRMIELYNKFSQADSTYKYRALYNDLFVNNYFTVKKDKFLQNEDEWRQRNEFISHELELQRKSTMLVCVIIVLLLVCAFIVYRFLMLRRHQRETLEQNREYVEVLNSLRNTTEQNILDTDIAHRFHSLSSQDSHPTAEEWQTLRNEVDHQYPQLFTILDRQYARYQPYQSMTQQERNAICLLTIRCTPLQMSVLLVCSKSNVSNLRRRLYTKLTGKDGSGIDLDKYIIELCK